MSKLISGKEALIALANSEEVEVKFNSTDGWNKINQKDAYSFEIFLNPIRTEFRLKPRTITINGIEVPAPFKPKEGEEFYNIQPCNESGWMGDKLGYKKGFCDNWIQFGAWRTEEEIRQVVAALRSVFKPQ